MNRLIPELGQDLWGRLLANEDRDLDAVSSRRWTLDQDCIGRRPGRPGSSPARPSLPTLATFFDYTRCSARVLALWKEGLGTERQIGRIARPPMNSLFCMFKFFLVSDSSWCKPPSR